MFRRHETALWTEVRVYLYFPGYTYPKTNKSDLFKQ